MVDMNVEMARGWAIRRCHFRVCVGTSGQRSPKSWEILNEKSQ